ncbi:MAG TPA: hypothetical protein VLA61_04250 [Ideonella sp.]|uniref:hypothetical protein n=1 Tax=Ideonella sp. TaxID=1929293 RepID=UPI002B8D16DB|nr:hypothetical protein [Ideonella sp.]HSI47451.1 hypothetical protein [Ideonella sp.]
MSQAARPRLVLHIGTHKTGTSSLQHGLAAAQQRLLQQHGLFYPDTRRQPMPALPKHCSVFRAAISEDPQVQDRERRTLMQEWQAAAAQGACTMLVSEEGLSEPVPRIPAFFAPLAATFDIEVLCYLRRQDLFAESLFNQFTRETVRREARPVLGFVRAEATRARLDYHAMLSRWTALPARVQVLDFDSAAVREMGLQASFAQCLGLPALDLPEEQANVSPDMRLALLLNRMNRMQLDYALPPLMRAAEALARDGAPVKKQLLGRQERQQLLADFADGNRRLAADFGVQFSDTLPAGEGDDATEELEVPYLLRLLSQLSQRAARKPGGAA